MISYPVRVKKERFFSLERLLLLLLFSVFYAISRDFNIRFC